MAAAGAGVIFSASIYGLTVDRRIRAIEAYRETLLNQTISKLPKEQFEPTLKALTEINQQLKKTDFLDDEDNKTTFTTVFESFKENEPTLS